MTGKYQIILISDSTGETLGRIFLAIQSQFASFEYDKKEYVFIRTEQQIDKIIGLNRIPEDLKVEPKITEEWTYPNDNKKRLEEYNKYIKTG